MLLCDDRPHIHILAFKATSLKVKLKLKFHRHSNEHNTNKLYGYGFLKPLNLSFIPNRWSTDATAVIEQKFFLCAARPLFAKKKVKESPIVTVFNEL